MVKYQTNFGVIIVWFMIIMKYVDNEYWYTPTDKIVIIEGKLDNDKGLSGIKDETQINHRMSLILR